MMGPGHGSYCNNFYAYIVSVYAEYRECIISDAAETARECMGPGHGSYRNVCSEVSV